MASGDRHAVAVAANTTFSTQADAQAVEGRAVIIRLDTGIDDGLICGGIATQTTSTAYGLGDQSRRKAAARQQSFFCTCSDCSFVIDGHHSTITTTASITANGNIPCA